MFTRDDSEFSFPSEHLERVGHFQIISGEKLLSRNRENKTGELKKTSDKENELGSI